MDLDISYYRKEVSSFYYNAQENDYGVLLK